MARHPIDSGESIWHPFTILPLRGPRAVMARAKGAYVYDDKGTAYLDATSSWWCNLHGHCHPRLVKALKEQAEVLDQILLAPHAHPKAMELASKLVTKLGDPFAKVFYSDDGSTAVEAALKMSVQYWHQVGQRQRKYFLSLERSYHGDTLGAVSVSGVSEFHHVFDKTIHPSLKSTAPYCYRCPMKLQYPDCGIACLERAKKVVHEMGDEIAALVVEPLILGAGGMLVYPKEYLESLSQLCRQYDILILFDEVFTGFGRTGTLFAMDQIEGHPDIVCLSKGLTSGMLPLAATVVTRKVFEAFVGEDKTFYHGHTFTGNALSCAVALESLKLFEENNVIENNVALIQIMEGQRTRFSDLPHVGDVRHLGMIWAVELVANKRSQSVFEPANGPGWKIAQSLWKQGIWIRPLDNMLYVIPPYCIEKDELERVFQLLYEEIGNADHFPAAN